MMTNPRAYAHYNSSKGLAIFSSILSGSGGFLLGWEIFGNQDKTMMAIGLGAIVLSFPPKSWANRKMEKAISIINGDDVSKLRRSERHYLNVQLTQNGFECVFSF